VLLANVHSGNRAPWYVAGTHFGVLDTPDSERMMQTVGPGAGPSTGDHVPVEHRWLGLDRRTIPLALVVLGLMLVFMVVIPVINDYAVDWDDETAAGDVLDLGNGVTVVPPTGWDLTSGIRVDGEPVSGISGDGSASIGSNGVFIDVTRANFDGTPDELLDQVNRLRTKSNASGNQAFKVTGPRTTVTTAAGLTGVSEAYTSASGEGRVLALTLAAGDDGTTPTGVTITVDATDSAYAGQSAAIDALVDSLAFEESAP